jgi:hypothetical protein
MLIFLIGQKNMTNLVEDRVDGGFNVIGDIPSIHGNTGQPSPCQPSTVEPITTFPMIWEFFVWQSIVIQHGLTTLHSLVAYTFVRISFKCCVQRNYTLRESNLNDTTLSQLFTVLLYPVENTIASNELSFPP